MNSVWTESVKQGGVGLPRFDSLGENIKSDVLIIGGGIAGLLCAYHLEKAGVSYTLVEADRICSGTTKNTTAKITSQHGLIYSKLVENEGVERARAYLLANEAALSEYRTLARGLDCDFETRDSYIYSLNDRAALEKEMEALSLIGYNAELCDTPELPFDTVGAVKFARQAQFNPLKFLAYIAKGLNIFENTKVRELRGLVAVTDKGEIEAKKIIIATHFPIINKHGAYFVKMYQHRSYVVALEGAGKIDGMYLDESSGGLSLRRYKDLLLLGGGGHRTGKSGGAYQELEAFAKKKFPFASIKYRWAAQDPITLDSMPYIGNYSSATPDVFVITGFNKWGMTSAMLAARIISDSIIGAYNEYSELFSPSRPMRRPEMFKNIFSSAAGLIKPTRPRCPHLGCALTWNSAEHSWDCPCHGSRFSEDGKLLDGPATADLDI